MSWRECVGADGGLAPAAVAAALRLARQSGRVFDVPLSAEVGLSLADAYRVQDQVTALRLAGGERRAGWKLGYTSAVMRAQMGIEAPNFGPLTDAMLLESPARLPGGALQPRVEPEIGLRLGRRLAGPCSISDVLDACDAALACLEVVDSVWSGYRFTLEDNTADGSSAAWAVVGPVMPSRIWLRCRWRCRWTARSWRAGPVPRRAGTRPWEWCGWRSSWPSADWRSSPGTWSSPAA